MIEFECISKFFIFLFDRFQDAGPDAGVVAFDIFLHLFVINSHPVRFYLLYLKPTVQLHLLLHLAQLLLQNFQLSILPHLKFNK